MSVERIDRDRFQAFGDDACALCERALKCTFRPAIGKDVSPSIVLQYIVLSNKTFSVLGFISAGHPLLPGNNGFKDQVVALKWVKEHISKFSGDPNLVTIAGQSAGSRSAALHMMSPMSKGLFHRVIPMSGSPVTPEPLSRHQKDLAEKQARILNCPTNDIKNMVDCMKTKPVEEFANSLSKFNVSQFIFPSLIKFNI